MYDTTSEQQYLACPQYQQYVWYLKTVVNTDVCTASFALTLQHAHQGFYRFVPLPGSWLSWLKEKWINSNCNTNFAACIRANAPRNRWQNFEQIIYSCPLSIKTTKHPGFANIIWLPRYVFHVSNWLAKQTRSNLKRSQLCTLLHAILFKTTAKYGVRMDRSFNATRTFPI